MYYYVYVYNYTNLALTDQQIMNELLLHEGGLSSVPGLSRGLSGPLGQRYTSSSEGEEEGEQGGWTGAQPAQEQSTEEESSDEEFTMKVKHEDNVCTHVTIGCTYDAFLNLFLTDTHIECMVSNVRESLC